MTTLGRFAGQAAVVTGAASGIGLATAQQLMKEGARVIALDRDGAALEGLRPSAEPTRWLPIVADVADADAVERALSESIQRLGQIPTVLVQCAAIYRFAPLLETPTELWREVIGTNLDGTFLVAREFVRAASGAGQSGAIVNVASVAAYRGEGVEPKAAYGASKAGVIHLTKQMAVEWAPLGFRVNVVVPGPIDTPMLRIVDQPELGNALLAALPLHRFGTPAEAAAVICFLASDEASYVTGAAIPVDGGLLAAHVALAQPFRSKGEEPGA